MSVAFWNRTISRGLVTTQLFCRQPQKKGKPEKVIAEHFGLKKKCAVSNLIKGKLSGRRNCGLKSAEVTVNHQSL